VDDSIKCHNKLYNDAQVIIKRIIEEKRMIQGIYFPNPGTGKYNNELVTNYQ